MKSSSGGPIRGTARVSVQLSSLSQGGVAPVCMLPTTPGIFGREEGREGEERRGGEGREEGSWETIV